MCSLEEACELLQRRIQDIIELDHITYISIVQDSLGRWARQEIQRVVLDHVTTVVTITVLFLARCEKGRLEFAVIYHKCWKVVF